MIAIDFRAFSEELEKLSFKLTPSGKAEVKAATHLEAETKDWTSFEKNLRSPAFRRAVLQAEAADPKLKKYVKTFGAYQGSKDVIAEITSGTSGKTYKVKDLHNGRWGCGCKDWQFIHSIKGGDCKHIKSVKQSKLVKTSSQIGVALTTVNRAIKHHEKGKAVQKNVREMTGPRYNPDHLLPWDERLAKLSL
jgi:hypothetical protein